MEKDERKSALGVGAELQSGVGDGKNKNSEAEDGSLQAKMDELYARIARLEGNSTSQGVTNANEAMLETLASQNSDLEAENRALASQNEQLERRLRALERKKGDSPHWREAMVGVVALIVVLVVALSFAFTLKKWWQWEHVIGAFTLPVIFLGLYAFLRKEKDTCFSVFEIVVFVLTIVNTALALSLKDDYKIISYWMCGYSLFAPVFTIAIGRRYNEVTSGLLLFGWIISLVMIFFTAYLI